MFFFLVFVPPLPLICLLDFRPASLHLSFYVFLLVASEVLWDLYKRGWSYVSAARANYVIKTLAHVIAIILLTWLFLLPRHPILWLAVPLIAIYIPVAITKYTQKINQRVKG